MIEHLLVKDYNNENFKSNNHVQVVKYYIERVKLVFINKNEVECLGEIINLLETLHSEFETQEEVAIA